MEEFGNGGEDVVVVLCKWNFLCHLRRPLVSGSVWTFGTVLLGDVETRSRQGKAKAQLLATTTYSTNVPAK